MPHRSPALPVVFHASYGAHILDHLALPRSTTSLACKHLELGLGDVDAVAGGIAAGIGVGVVVGIVVAHGRSLPFSFREAFTSRRS